LEKKPGFRCQVSEFISVQVSGLGRIMVSGVSVQVSVFPAFASLQTGSSTGVNNRCLPWNLKPDTWNLYYPWNPTSLVQTWFRQNL